MKDENENGRENAFFPDKKYGSFFFFRFSDFIEASREKEKKYGNYTKMHLLTERCVFLFFCQNACSRKTKNISVNTNIN